MAVPNNNHKLQLQLSKNSKSLRPNNNSKTNNNNNNHNNNKKKYNGNGKGNNNSFRQTESSAKLKKNKRDLERLLKKKDLPADIKHEKEKALQAINLSLQNTAHGLKAQEYARKYHMVKFFERKKVFRKYKQAKKELETLQNKLSDAQQQPKDNTDSESSKQTTPQPQQTTTDTAAIKKEIKKTKKKLHHCEIDLLYVYNYPKDEKYISLYPKDEKDAPKLCELPEAVRKGKKITEEERLSIKKRIQTMLDDGSLPITMDDILSGNVDHSKLEQQQRFAKLEEPDKIVQRQNKGKKNNKKEMDRKRQDEDQTQNGGEDDDFFE